MKTNRDNETEYERGFQAAIDGESNDETSIEWLMGWNDGILARSADTLRGSLGSSDLPSAERLHTLHL